MSFTAVFEGLIVLIQTILIKLYRKIIIKIKQLLIKI